jgi:hypothetical protein
MAASSTWITGGNVAPGVMDDVILEKDAVPARFFGYVGQVGKHPWVGGDGGG